MSKISRKIKTLFHEPNIFAKKLSKSRFLRHCSDKVALKIKYKAVFGRKLNLKNPQTFNEKLQWLKLYNRKPEYTTMVDKYAAKKYVANIIGEEYIIPTLGVWEKFDDINFDDLPNQFVLKTTHGSGDVVICKDKNTFDKESAKKKLTKALKTDFYKISREWPYKNVPRRIIAEQYMECENGQLNDYKLFVFNGHVKCCFVVTDRFSSQMYVTFFDRSGALMPFERGYPSKKEGLQLPPEYEKMIDLAEKLAKDVPFLRVDFYNVNNIIFLGELTFFPGGGFEQFNPDDWDCRLGEWLQLPQKSK